MRSAIGCAALGLLLLLVAGTFDAEPLYVTGSALLLLGAGALAWIGVGGFGAKLTREIGVRSVIEEQPLQVKLLAKSGRLPLPPGWIDEPLLPEPLRLPAGRRQARVRIEVTFARRGRRIAAGAGAGPARPVRARRARDRRAAHRRAARAAEDLPGEPHRGWGRRDPRARARLAAGRRRDRDRRPAPLARGLARLAHPLAVLRPRRRADGAQADLRGRLAPARGDGPARAHLARGARRRRPRRRVAGRALRAQDRLLAADARRPPRERDRARPDVLAEPPRPARAARGRRRPVAGRRPEPPRPRRLRRRPPDRPRPARPRPHPGRLPRRRPGHASPTAARSSRSPAATATSPAASPAPPPSPPWRAPQHDAASTRRGSEPPGEFPPKHPSPQGEVCGLERDDRAASPAGAARARAARRARVDAAAGAAQARGAPGGGGAAAGAAGRALRGVRGARRCGARCTGCGCSSRPSPSAAGRSSPCR